MIDDKVIPRRDVLRQSPLLGIFTRGQSFLHRGSLARLDEPNVVV